MRKTNKIKKEKKRMREVRLREKRKSTDEMVKGSSEVEAYLLR